MCYKKPGPRCSNHALKTLSNAHDAWGKAHTSVDRSIAMKNLKEAEEQYDTTPFGQRDLQNAIIYGGDQDGLLSARSERGIAKRKQMLRDIKTKDVGDIDDNDSPLTVTPRTRRRPTSRSGSPDSARSIISLKGDKKWYLNGKLGREGGKPAVECADGSKEWWANGELHREGGKPAIKYANGTKEWWVNGKCHREGGKPAMEYADGHKAWYVNGEFVKQN